MTVNKTYEMKDELRLSKSNLVHSAQLNMPNILKNIWPFIMITFLNMAVLDINLVVVSYLPDGINMAIGVGLVTPFLASFVHSTAINGISLGLITKKPKNQRTNDVLLSEHENTFDFTKIKSSFYANILYSIVMIGLYVGSTYGYFTFEVPPSTPEFATQGFGQCLSTGYDYIFITAPIILFYAIKSWSLKMLISFGKLKIVVTVVILQIIMSIGLASILAIATPLGVIGAGLGLLIVEAVFALFVFWYLLTIIGIRFFFLRTHYAHLWKAFLGTWKYTFPFIIISLVKCSALVIIGIYFLQTPTVEGLVDHQILISVVVAFNFVNLVLFLPRGVGHGLIYIFVDKRMCLNDFFSHKTEIVRAVLKLWWISFIVTSILFAIYPAFTYCLVLDSSPDYYTIFTMGQDINIPYTGSLNGLYKGNEHQILTTFINDVNIKLIPVYFLLVSYIAGHNTALVYGPFFSLVLGKNTLFYWILLGHGMTFVLMFTVGLTLFGYWAFGLADHSIFPLMIPFALHGIYLVIITTIWWKKSVKSLINKHKDKYIAICQNCLIANKDNKDVGDLSKFYLLNTRPVKNTK